MRNSPAKIVAFIGVMAATIECAKLALSFLPNIEVVTLLIALYSYTFGIYGLLASVVFVSIEPVIYGFGTWVVSYYIYWPTVFKVEGEKSLYSCHGCGHSYRVVWNYVNFS